MKKKHISIMLILSLFSFLLTGCYDSVGMENTAYAIALGIDKADSGRILLSVQFSLPEGAEDGSENSSEVISVEAANIDSGISLINGYISKKINLSHVKVIVISQELAALRNFRVYIHFGK